MFHDPEMEVTCDNENCNESVFLPMVWTVGGYDLSDDAAKQKLEFDHDWIVRIGKHYCCHMCELI